MSKISYSVVSVTMMILILSPLWRLSIPKKRRWKNRKYFLTAGITLISGFSDIFSLTVSIFPSIFAMAFLSCSDRGISLFAVIDAQAADCSDEELLKLQAELNSVYDKFKKSYGNITDVMNERCFRHDDDFNTLAALEIVDTEKKTVEKSEIFFKRTIQPELEITSVDTPQEALQPLPPDEFCAYQAYGREFFPFPAPRS